MIFPSLHSRQHMLFCLSVAVSLYQYTGKIIENQAPQNFNVHNWKLRSIDNPKHSVDSVGTKNKNHDPPFDSSNPLLAKPLINELGRSLARSFVEEPPQVCSLRHKIKTQKENDPHLYEAPEGLMYVKLPQTASSTLSGINARIAIKLGQRLYANNSTVYKKTTCTHFEDHVVPSGRWYRNRNPSRSFLWGSLRDPASRAISSIFSSISQTGDLPTDENILSRLKGDVNRQQGTISDGKGGFQLRYLSLNHIGRWSAWNETAPTTVQDPKAVQENVEQVIQNYDFLALTERLDESLVVIQLLLDLPVSDILSTSSKVGGGYFYVEENGKSRCIPLQKSFRSPAVHAYLESDEWYAKNYGDYLLFAAANQSLDKTIERLGKIRFAKALREYRESMKLVKEKCNADAFLPCYASGKTHSEVSNQHCYRGDEGCGYNCIDELEKQRSDNKILDKSVYPIDESDSPLTKEWFDQFGKTLARPFDEQLPEVCSLRPKRKTKHIKRDLGGKKGRQLFVAPQGLMYVKMPKAASSTLAGINTRIAIKLGQRLYNNDTTKETTACTHFEGHVIDPGIWYGNRDPTRSFLWGSVRDPASRAISRIFFSSVSQQKNSPTDDNILYNLKEDADLQYGSISHGQGGFQLRYLSLEPIEKWSAWNETKAATVVQDPKAVQENVEQVIHNYDFLALTERLDESLVAMQLLLGLPVGDILSTSSKVGGGYACVGKECDCVAVQKSFRSPTVQAYLESDEWYAKNYGDYLLYAAANHSLDLTIERLGKTRFAKALQEYRAAMKLVKENCDANSFLPCSTDGTSQLKVSEQHCYKGDEGCGYNCIDGLGQHGLG